MSLLYNEYSHGFFVETSIGRFYNYLTTSNKPLGRFDISLNIPEPFKVKKFTWGNPSMFSRYNSVMQISRQRNIGAKSRF